MEKEINSLLSEDLTDTNIRELCPNIKIYLFRELARFNNIKDLFLRNGGYAKAVIILFPVRSMLDGHWICLIDHGYYFEHFDSYGFSPIKEYSYTMTGVPNYLEALYTKSEMKGVKIEINPYQFQQQKDGINTCGRHACCRAKYADIPISEYKKLLFDQKYTPDQLVVLMTIIQIDT